MSGMAVSRGAAPRWIRLVPLSASVAAGATLSALRPSVDAALVAGIVVVLALPLGARAARRRLDVLEPLAVASLAFLVMYVLRPAALLAGDGRREFKGYDYAPTLTEALALALLAVLAFQIGYALPWAGRLARRLSAAPGRWDVQTTVAFAVALAVVAVALYSVFLVQSGGVHVLGEFVQGRSSAQDAYFRNSSAYLYAAPQLLWPASLLLFAVGLAERRRTVLALSFVFMAPLAVFASGQGSRIVLLPLLLSPAVYWLLVRGRRPGPLALALAGYLVLTVGIAYFRDTRTATEQISRVAELQRAVTDPTYELEELVVHGTDNDMLESLAVELLVVPERLPVSPTDFAYRTLAKPIPSIVWESKPVAPEELLVDTLYPSERVRASSSAGLVGSLYLAGGAVGVGLGMLAVGFAFRVPWEFARLHRSIGTPQLLLTAFLMFIPILLRGGIGDTLARALFGIVPLVVALRLCRRASDEEPA